MSVPESSPAAGLGPTAGEGPPVVSAEGRAAGRDAPTWIAEHVHTLSAQLDQHGAVLVRGLGLASAEDARAAFCAVAPPVPQREPFAAREQVADQVYSAASWPRMMPMCHHHEQSYRRTPPRLVMLACLQAPTEGGATTLADTAAVLDDLPADLVERFADRGWELTRSYGGDVGGSLVEVFGTDDLDRIADYCAEHEIELERTGGGRAVTRQRRPAVVEDRATGRRRWFNQVAFLSEWTMDPDVREFLVSQYGHESLPFNTRFGDGQEVSADVIDQIHASYTRATVREPWSPGDLMLIDNLKMAHSREPYTGERRVLVGLAETVDLGAWR